MQPAQDKGFRGLELCCFLLRPQWLQGACAGILPNTQGGHLGKLDVSATQRCTVSRMAADSLERQPFWSLGP